MKVGRFCHTVSLPHQRLEFQGNIVNAELADALATLQRMVIGSFQLRGPQYLFHLTSLHQLVHQFVEISGLLRQRCLNFFNSIATNGTGDQAHVCIERGLGEELLKRRIIFNQPIQIFFIETRQPENDLVQFFFGSALLLNFRNIERINRGKGHIRDTLVVFFGCLHDRFFGRQRFRGENSVWNKPKYNLNQEVLSFLILC